MDTDKLIKKKLDELKERFYIELSNNHLYLAEDASAKALTIFFKSSLKEALQARDKWWKNRIKEKLKGIDKTETDSDHSYDGWWETSTGAKFGARILNELLDDDYDVWLKKEQKENRIIEKNL